jgi:hypothetical protein
MKRIMIFTLAAAVLLTSLATPAMAYEPAPNMRQEQNIEGNRGRNRHRRGRGNDWVGFGIGAALGLAVGAGVGSSSRQEHHYYYPQPQPQYYQPAQPTLVYDPNCNCYYYR